MVGLALIERGDRLALLATKEGLEAIALEHGPPNALAGLAFQVAPGSDLAAVARALSEEGLKTERRSAISPGISDAVVFTDPKGTEIAIFAEYTFAADDGRQAGVMPIKLGHVAYRVNDVAKVVKLLYRDSGFPGVGLARRIFLPSCAAGPTTTASISYSMRPRSSITSPSK